MLDPTFAEFMQRERDRLHAEREAVLTRQRELESTLTAINNEVLAIDAYEAAKSGRAASASVTGSARPVRRGSQRDALLSMIRKYPFGLRRREILEKLELRGDERGEMSISNMLTALVKGKQIERREGRYHATAQP